MRAAERATDSLEEVMNIRMKIFAPHRARNVTGTKTRPEHSRERSSRPKHAFSVKRFGEVFGIGEEALDSLILRIVPEHSPQRRRYEQVALDVALTPYEEFEALFAHRPILVAAIG